MVKKFTPFLLLCALCTFIQAVSQTPPDGIPVPGIIPVVNKNTPDPIGNNRLSSQDRQSITPSAPTGNSSEAGITEGNLTVSLSGAANYTIPIEVLPGIKGIVPQISLSYDSQSGNNIAGYGWSVSGLSSITRIPSTKYHDGIPDPVDFDNLDRFALDGQRLRIKNGTSGTYGANGTVYETENFSTTKVTSFGVSPLGAIYGPQYFLVEYPDGSKAQYGNHLESRSELKWSIDYWENPQGIRINYSYAKFLNISRIMRISYGAIGANKGCNTIYFHYKKRNRYENAYIGGIPFTEAYILSYIQVHPTNAFNSHYRKYSLTHDSNSLGYERLTRITESSACEGTVKSRNPTVFTYDDTPDTLFYNPIATNLSANNISYKNAATVTGDFNGDGKTDIILYPTFGSDARKKYWLFTNFQENQYNIGSEIPVPESFDEIVPVSWLGGSSSYGYKLMQTQAWTLIKTNPSDNTTTFSTYAAGTASPVYFQDRKSYQFPKFSFRYDKKPCAIGLKGPELIIFNHTANAIPTEITKEIPKTYLSGDFNGDGLTDLIAVDKSVPYSYRQGCNSYNNQRPGGQSYFINLDKRIPSGFVNNAGQLTITNYSIIRVVDYNGDGKSDILVFDSGKVTVYTLNNNNLLIQLCTYADSSINLNYPILMGDYNGDGKADFILPTGSGHNFVKYSSTGISFSKSKHHYSIPYHPSTQENDCSFVRHIIPTDFNLDGKTDLIYVENFGCSNSGKASITVQYYKNTSTNFAPAGSASTPASSTVDRYSLPAFISFDKINNSQDISFIAKNNIFNFKAAKSNAKDTTLNSITLGNGVQDRITYHPLIAPDTNTFDLVYNDSPNIENYPNADISNAPSISVVSRLERRSKNEYKKQDYKYCGAVYNVEGLGFLGFRSTMSTNWYNDPNEIISTISKFDISRRGALSESYTVTGLAIPSVHFTPTSFISKSIITYSATLLSNKVFKIKTDTSTTINSLKGTTTEVSASYDDFQNLLTHTTVDKQGNTVDKKTVVTFDYFNQPQGTPYSIGRPTKKNTETYGSDQMNTEEIYAYNANNLLSEIKTKGHNTDYVTTRYEYDTFGNVTKNTLTANGITPRISSMEYDPGGRFITKSTSIEGLNTIYTYNNHSGLLLTVTTPDGRTVAHEYDLWGRKTKITDYFSTVFSYSNVDEKTRVTVSGDDGSYRESLLDDLGRLIKSGVKNIDGSISYTDFVYDILGRKIKSSEPYIGSAPSQWNEVTFDPYDRLVKSIAATGKTQTITYSGLTTRVYDGLKTESITKNAANNVISKTDDISSNNAINQQYFANGGLKQVNYGDSSITIEQDGWGRKTQLKDPSAGTYQYSYNSLGAITKETTPNGVIDYTYDQFGRLETKQISSTDSDVPYAYYMYNPDGTLASKNTDNASVDGDQVTEVYEYDTFKRPKKIIYVTATSEFVKELTYDSFGRVEKEKLTATSLTNNKTSTKTFKYTYKNGYVYQIMDDATSQVLWSTNNVNQRGQTINGSFGNGLTQVNTYDSFGFPSVFETKNTSGSLFNFTTTFDPIRENLSSRTNSLFNTTEPFEYDNQDRLVKWNKELVTLHNNDFSSGTAEFGTQLGAVVTNQNGQLKVTATQGYAGVIKTIVTQAKIGDKFSIKVKVDKGTTNKVRVLVVESDPASGLWNESFKGYAQNGILEFEHTVTQYPYITLNIDKDGTGNDIGTATVFHIDDLWVGKQLIEKQHYDDRGRITENNLGQYNYTDVNKTYQNTSIDLNTEDTSYYQSREGIFNDGMEAQKGWEHLLKYGGVPSGYPIYDDSKAKSGKYSLKIHSPGYILTAHSLNWIPIDNPNSVSYTFSGWIYSDGPASRILLFMNSETETGYYTIVADQYTEVTNQWVYLERTIQVPSYIKKLSIRVDNNGGGNVWFDDIRIRKTDNPKTDLRQLDIQYDVFRKPRTITETGIEKIDFKYNDSHYRTSMFYGGLQTDIKQRQFRKDYSFDGSTEITTNQATGESSFVFFVGGDAYSAPAIVKDNGTTAEYLYLHRDYQGSILAITNQAGAVVEKRLFDPWGNIVKIQDGQSRNLVGLTVLDRGYTGHEHLQSVGIINMNGRLYDPKLRRFLSSDNHIQDLYNTQNYNRYGYCLNNPLKYVDYSGEIYGNEHNHPEGLSSGGQIGIGSLIQLTVYNYDQWRIKDWSNQVFSARNYNNAVNGVTNFIDSGVGFFKSLFGGSPKTQAQPIATPQFSNYQSTTGWQEKGFLGGVKYGGDGSGSFMDYLHKFVYLTDQLNPIALAWDGLSGYITGEDRYGNALSGAESGVKLVSAIPIAEAEMLAANALSKVTARVSTGFISKSIAKAGGNVAAKGEKELFNFSARAAGHMAEKGRAVPIQILERAIRGSKGVADPRGSRALMHTTEMWKNGKIYNLEVLYDKTTNSIWHFKYCPK
ncbi:FG-GAP-like repeat-containing protein [Flavobacterium sp. WV_118_3]|uniref:FG-GAP-like repeat-containing protein n=1 Tax=Flavobacterium sp. WV_118_3 TaxID=3151764 RepID=UPI003219DACD